ncbi:hypothetical protein MKX01_010409 [Papaver californicum]|nr:hypothetical protein MKX01_010409 [Papaver californicum]
MSVSQASSTMSNNEYGSDALHILVVDDTSFELKLVERLLKKSSYKGEGKENCNKQIKSDLSSFIFSFLFWCGTWEQKVNMIITDYCMPEMMGYDFLKRFKVRYKISCQESSTLREIPVVILSSEDVPTRISSFLLQKYMCSAVNNHTHFYLGKYKCLEEGVEEFLLKLLRKSDISRLHNHMLLGNAVMESVS